MKSPALRRLFAVVAPEGLLLLLLLWLGRTAPVAEAVAAIPTYAVATVYAAGALLAWRFRRTRAVLAILALALAHPVLATSAAAAQAAAHGSSLPAGAAAFLLVAVLLPADLVVLAFLGDRGLLTRSGLARLAVIAGQVGIVVLLAVYEPAPVVEWLGRELVPAGSIAWTSVPQPVLLAFGAALGVLGVGTAIQPDPIRRGLLWATAALLLAVHAAAAGDTPTVPLLTAAIVLIVAVVESSYALAYRDGLTGLPSRRAFNEELRRLGGRYAIAMADVDRFKGVNDRYGHDVGDQVLRLVASQLARISGGGKAFRYGGEEFALVFAGKRLDEVVPHLEAVRAAIEVAGFTVRAPDRPRRKPKKPRPARGERKTLKITVSIGIAERTDRHPEPESVVQAADRALYRAKNAGRNRVVA